MDMLKTIIADWRLLLGAIVVLLVAAFVLWRWFRLSGITLGPLKFERQKTGPAATAGGPVQEVRAEKGGSASDIEQNGEGQVQQRVTASDGIIKGVTQRGKSK